MRLGGDSGTDHQRHRLVSSERSDEDIFKANLYKLIVEPEVYRSEELTYAFEQNAETNMAMMQTLLALSTEKQQNRLVKEIGEYRQDVIDLMAWEPK